MPIDARIPMMVDPIKPPDIIGPFERVQGMRLKERAQSLDDAPCGPWLRPARSRVLGFARRAHSRPPHPC